MKPHMPKGLRHFSRVPFAAKVQLVVGEQTWDVNLVDIALKGALVETDTAQPLALQTACRLVLPLAGVDDAIVMVGSVAHLEGRHVGIQCQQIDIDHLTRLRRLLALNMGNADLVDRELSLLFNS